MQQQHLAENSSSDHHLYRFLARNGVGPYHHHYPTTAGGDQPPQLPASVMHSFCSSSSNNYYPLDQASASDHIDQSTPQDRALAALRNHKEAEKRRRERINSHLNNLRTLLPCNSKTDKASLLAKVVQRVKELKQQTLDLTELETFPSETDEITVAGGEYMDRRLIFTASFCCEDRSDLFPELMEILRSLNLKTLKAEMATLGGRVRNVLVLAADDGHSIESMQLLQNALKALMERSNSSSERSKRRRVIDQVKVYQTQIV